MKRLGDEAARLLRAAGAGDAGEITAVSDVWAECVGETIARAAWPRRLANDGTLHVATVSSTWAFELGRLEPELGERLRAVLGSAAPVALRFAPGPVPEPAELPDDSAGPPEITPETRAEAAALTAEVESDELRELLARAAAASLQKGRSDRGFC